jgi:hypothetical protein
MGIPGFFAEAAILGPSTHYRASAPSAVARERHFTPAAIDTGRGGGGDDMEWVDCKDQGSSICWECGNTGPNVLFGCQHPEKCVVIDPPDTAPIRRWPGSLTG